MKKQKNAQLVLPREEWPYEVPENWVWTRLKYIADLYNGDRGGNYPSKKDYIASGIPFINAGAIQNGTLNRSEFNFISKVKYDSLRAGRVRLNDILYCLRGSLGKTAIVDSNEEGAISSSLCILRAKNIINIKYFYHLLNSETIIKQQNAIENGSAQPNLSAANVMQYKIPLPPIPEQQRIVARIESLFAKLDAAAEKIRAALDQFPIRKAAILHKAFTGDLTKNWRKENGVGMESWGEYCLQELTDVRDGTHDSPLYYDTGFPLITSKNLRNGIITKTDVKYISKEDYDKINMRSKVAKGDILFAMIGTIGNPVVVEEYPDFAIKNVALFKDINKINMYYLQYFLDSESVKNRMNREAKGSTQKFVALQYLRKFHITVPPLPEQQEIVRILDVIFEREQAAKETAERLLEQIALIKKSILARAFRGLLGTNAPKEESAEGLLRGEPA